MNQTQSPFILTDKLEDIDRNQWSKFVAEHANGTFFQTPEYFELHQGIHGYYPYLILATKSDKKTIVGVLVAIRHHVYGGIAHYLTSRVIVTGGPLVDAHYPEVVTLLLQKFVHKMRFRAVYSEFRNLFDMSMFHAAFKRNNAFFEDHLDILIDLHKSEEDLWKDVRSQRRNLIRRAQKQSIEVRELSSEEERRQSWDVLKDLYRRKKLPLAPKELFERAFTFLEPKGILKPFGAFYQDQLIGTCYVLAYKKNLYYWYAGSSDAYYSLNPNDLMPWVVLLKGKGEQFDQFDFGGAGNPSIPYGVRDYKKSFGGTMVNYGRYELYHNKILFLFMRMAFRVWQKMQ